MKKTCETCSRSKCRGRQYSCILKGIPVRKDYGCEKHDFKFKTEGIYDQKDDIQECEG